jgi:hypothetical protein
LVGAGDGVVRGGTTLVFGSLVAGVGMVQKAAVAAAPDDSLSMR